MNLFKSKYLFPILVWAYCFPANAQKLAFQTTMQKSKPFMFMENKGQLMAPALKGAEKLSDIKYYGQQGGVNIYCRPGTISFVFTKVETTQDSSFSKASGVRIPLPKHVPGLSGGGFGRTNFNYKPSKITTSRIDLVLVGCNPKAQIINSDQQSYYENYYTTADANNGITNIHAYKELTYKNIWPNIYMVLKINQTQGMEYSFIIYPGGNVQDIQMKWNGADSINMLKNNTGIRYTNSLGAISETGLKAYFANSKESIRSKYRVGEGQSIGFAVDGYDKEKTLVIDPTLVWGTYFGGNVDAGAYGVKTDPSNNIFIVGETNSNTGIATAGAFLTSLPNMFGNTFLTKFNSFGQIQWSTYYGGNGGSSGFAVGLDGSGNSYITGCTASQNGIATSGAYQTALFAGNSADTDVFIAKFNNSGTILWATYYGGDFYNAANGIAVDDLGSAYITGRTKSFNGISTSDGYQTSLSSGYAGFLAKFSASGDLSYGTYFGDGFTSGNGTNVDAFNDIYITGSTTSPFGIATSGAYQTSMAGASDAFLAKFNLYIVDAGILSIQSPNANFCSGTNELKVQLKNYGTEEIDSVTINWSLNAVSQKPYHWQGKLATDSTALVTLPNYLFNPGTDTIKFWTSDPNGIKDIYPNNDSAITYFKVDAPPFAIIDYYPNITEICNGDTVLLDIGDYNPGNSYAWTSDSSSFSAFGVHISITPTITTLYKLTVTRTADGCTNSDSVKITVNPSPDPGVGISKTICNGNSSNIGSSPTNGYIYKWSSNPKGYSSTNSGAVVNPTITTTYKLIEIIAATGCRRTDSSTITVNPLPLATAGNPKTICAGTSIPIGSFPLQGHIYSWTSSPVGEAFNATISDPMVKPIKTTTYTLTEFMIGTGCRNSNSVIITVNPLPKPNAGKNYFLCLGDKIALGYPGTNGDSYQWSSIPAGFSSTLPQFVDSPKVTSKYILTETNTTSGCSNTDSAIITVVPPSKPIIIGSDSVCGFDSSVIYTVDSIVDSKWVWGVKKGTIISGQGTNRINVKFVSGFDTISVTETNAFGCAGTVLKDIRIQQNPDAHFKVLDHSPEFTFTALDSNEQYYAWNLGDSTKGSLYKMIHQYPFTRDSSFKVSLMVTSAFGCSAVYDTVVMVKAPVFNIKIFPNPFENSTHIQIELDKPSQTQIVVYDAIGRQITTLANTLQSPGIQTYTIDGDAYNLSDGVYFLKILVDDKAYVWAVVRE